MAEANNPFEQYHLDPNSGLRNEYMQMRMMNAADRQMPGLRAPRYGGRSGLDHANPMLTSMMQGGGQEDYSQFTYNPQAREAATKYLEQFRLSPLAPNQVNPNAVLPNTGFFGRHPRLASGLEGAMFGLASTRGGETTGESIANVATGLIEGPRMRQGLINRQFATPFQAANMMEQLQDRSEMRRYRGAEITHLEAENERYKHDKSYTPIPSTASSIMEFNPTTGQYDQKENKFYDPKATGVGSRNPWSGMETLRPFAESRGYKDPENITPFGWGQIRNDKEQSDIRVSGGKAGAGTSARINTPGELSDVQKENLKPIQSEMNKLDSKESDSKYRIDVLTDPKMQGKGMSDMQVEIKRRKDAKRVELQKQADQIMQGTKTGADSSPLPNNQKRIPTYDPATGTLR